MKKLLILLWPLASLGCAVVAEPNPQVAGVTCRKELPTGSNLPVTRCLSEEERKRQQEQVEAVGNDIQRSTSNKSRTSGP